MTSSKIITQLDITCNIAFIDITRANSKFFLLCCSGQKYSNYPVYGSSESGYTQHSSICNAAQACGIECGEQFFVFDAGESCRFPAAFQNGIKTNLFNDWSKAYKIKKVDKIFAEHKKLMQTIERLEENESMATEKISKLEIKVEQQKLDIETITARFTHLKTKNNQLEQQDREKALTIKTQRNALETHKKYPISEFLEMKKERIVQHKQILELDKEKRQLADANNSLKRQVDQINSDQTRKEKAKETLKTLSLSKTFDEIEQSQNRIQKIATDFQEELKNSEKLNSSNNAMSSMKKIFDILKTLNIEIDEDDSYEQYQTNLFKILRSNLISPGENGRNDEAKGINLTKNKAECNKTKEGKPESICSLITETLNRIQNNNGGENNTARERFAKRVKEFSQLSEQKEKFITELNEVSCRVWKAKLGAETTAKKPLKENEASRNDYQNLKDKLKELQEGLLKRKEEKDISNALKTSTAIEQLIRNEILPCNKRIRSELNEEIRSLENARQSVSTAELTEGIKKVEENERAANEDLVEIEKLSPVPEGEEELVAKVQKEKDRRETLRKELVESWGKISARIERFMVKCENLKEESLNLYLSKAQLENTRFEILRWEESKDDRIETLKEFIEKQRKMKNYLTALHDVFVEAKNCFERNEKDRLEEIRKSERDFREEYSRTFQILYDSIRKNCDNKRKQLVRHSRLKETLEAQIEDAIELMDEDAVEVLKKQIKGIPLKRKSLKEKIVEYSEELSKMEKDPLMFTQRTAEKIDLKEEKRIGNDLTEREPKKDKEEKGLVEKKGGLFDFLKK